MLTRTHRWVQGWLTGVTCRRVSLAGCFSSSVVAPLVRLSLHGWMIGAAGRQLFSRGACTGDLCVVASIASVLGNAFQPSPTAPHYMRH